MISLKTTIVNLLTSDATLQSLLGGTSGDKKVYPMISEKFEAFPCVTYRVTAGGFRLVPKNSQDTILEFHIYSKESSLAVENIFTRINNLLNYYKNQFNPVVYMVLETDLDANEVDRQLFGKIVRYRVWVKN